MDAGKTVRFLHLFLSCLLVAGCAGNKRLAPVDDRLSGTKVKSADWYTVHRGDTLYSISFAYGRNYLAVARLNNIHSPYTIYPGQRLRMSGTPEPVRKPVKKITRKAPAKFAHVKKVTRPSTKSKSTSRLTWQWPVNGKVIMGYSETAPRKKGIGIGGKAGQTIHSAAKGKVVYAGNGLIGYGNLIIIKHNDTYLSAYAHNDKIYVKEGQQVISGQKIASMGRNERNIPMLHFEIRRNGKPVNPISYLPRRHG